MSNVALGLGVNVGDRLAALRRATKSLSDKVGQVTAKSSVYETLPWGRTDQPRFLNACLTLETDFPPLDLLDEIKIIERDMGRIERAHWGPREIDIDVIFYDDLVLDDPKLKIPHPLMAMRAFVMVPLAEIAPGWKHPEGWTVAELPISSSSEGLVRMTAL
jgi:2-amino-4-hydroxy-6-hydroxymethyldihydropteridine diphosphokinase